jgi:hypothetical protein
MSSGVILGFHCSHEPHPPSVLLRHARLAAEAGFTAAMCSDHRASEHAAAADVLSKVRASSDIGRHIEWLHEDCALGFARIYLHNVARAYQERFIEVCGTQVLPAIARSGHATGT